MSDHWEEPAWADKCRAERDKQEEIMDELEEDLSIESLTKEDIWEETKSMTLETPPKPVNPLGTGEIMRAPMDISKEMELLRRTCPEDEDKRIRDILEKAGPIRTTEQIWFCHERCRVLCSKPEWCPFADNPFS